MKPSANGITRWLNSSDYNKDDEIRTSLILVHVDHGNPDVLLFRLVIQAMNPIHEAAKARKLAAQRIRRNAFRSDLQDESVSSAGDDKSRRINLGLALLHRVALPRVAYGSDEIAAWAGCSQQAIERIEQAALRKLRVRLLPLVRE